MLREAAFTVNPHDTWNTFKELVGRRGYSEIVADDLMLQGAKEAIGANPWKYLLSRCRRYAWFWITPNGCFRPKTGDYLFGIDRASTTEGSNATGINVNGKAPGQFDLEAPEWYFQQGRLNFLRRQNPLIYALAALASPASIGILGIRC